LAFALPADFGVALVLEAGAFALEAGFAEALALDAGFSEVLDAGFLLVAASFEETLVAFVARGDEFVLSEARFVPAIVGVLVEELSVGKGMLVEAGTRPSRAVTMSLYTRTRRLTSICCGLAVDHDLITGGHVYATAYKRHCLNI
jgi:hypothetical protein